MTETSELKTSRASRLSSSVIGALRSSFSSTTSRSDPRETVDAPWLFDDDDDEEEEQQQKEIEDVEFCESDSDSGNNNQQQQVDNNQHEQAGSNNEQADSSQHADDNQHEQADNNPHEQVDDYQHEIADNNQQQQADNNKRKSISSRKSTSATRHTSSDHSDDDELKWDFEPDDLGGLDERLWVPCSQGTTDVWLVADVITYSKGRTTVTVSVDAYSNNHRSVDNDDNMELLVQTYPVSATFAYHESHSQDSANAALLNDLNEPALLNLLRYRYTHGSIYTLSGDILISVNPNSIMPDISGIVSPDEQVVIKDLMDNNNREQGTSKDMQEEVPHIFAVAKRAYENVVEQSKDQSILINGESGSGKTEASKAILRCLAAMSARSNNSGINNDKNSSPEDPLKSINSSILASSPVLEAFGNAITGSNTNSSRFGKFMEINYKNGEIVGASTKHFLLETSRVISHSYGERNFHVLYRMLAGLSEEDKVKLDIDGYSALEFSYLCETMPSKASFAEMGGRGGGEGLGGLDGLVLLADDEENTAKAQAAGIKTASHMFSGKRFSIEEQERVDAAAHHETVRAMKALGFSDDECLNVFRILAGILLLGNIPLNAESAPLPPSKAGVGNPKAQPQTQNEEDEDVLHRMIVNIPADNEFLRGAARQLGFKSSADLANALTNKTVFEEKGRLSRTSTPVVVSLSVAQARISRDALAKFLYGALFAWIVDRVNIQMHAGDGAKTNGSIGNGSGDLTTIGILDIFGFEVLDSTNNKANFEQLCINYANEMLQKQFNKHVFVNEQARYKHEGIKWEMLGFQDNQPLLELFQGRDGIFHALDQQAVLGDKGSINTFLSTLTHKHGKNNNLFVPDPNGRPRFSVRHFAGNVEYRVQDFLIKNNDTLQPNLLALLEEDVRKKPQKNSGRASEDFLEHSEEKRNSFLSKIVDFHHRYELQQLEQQKNAREKEKLRRERKQGRGSVVEGSDGGVVARRGSKAKGGKMAQLSTVGIKFQRQIRELTTLLNRTSPHFVRCVKPNRTQSPLEWDGELVLNQLRHLGVMESVRIRREGFPVRRKIVDFANKYERLLREPTDSGIHLVEGENELTVCETILSAVLGEDSRARDWQCGSPEKARHVFLGSFVLLKLDRMLRQLEVDDEKLLEEEQEVRKVEEAETFGSEEAERLALERVELKEKANRLAEEQIKQELRRKRKAEKKAKRLLKREERKRREADENARIIQVELAVRRRELEEQMEAEQKALRVRLAQEEIKTREKLEKELRVRENQVKAEEEKVKKAESLARRAQQRIIKTEKRYNEQMELVRKKFQEEEKEHVKKQQEARDAARQILEESKARVIEHSAKIQQEEEELRSRMQKESEHLQQLLRTNTAHSLSFTSNRRSQDSRSSINAIKSPNMRESGALATLQAQTQLSEADSFSLHNKHQRRDDRTDRTRTQVSDSGSSSSQNRRRGRYDRSDRNRSKHSDSHRGNERSGRQHENGRSGNRSHRDERSPSNRGHSSKTEQPGQRQAQQQQQQQQQYQPNSEPSPETVHKMNAEAYLTLVLESSRNMVPGGGHLPKVLRPASAGALELVTLLQSHMRAWLIRSRYTNIWKTREPWKQYLRSNEAVVYSSMVLMSERDRSHSVLGMTGSRTSRLASSSSKLISSQTSRLSTLSRALGGRRRGNTQNALNNNLSASPMWENATMGSGSSLGGNSIGSSSSKKRVEMIFTTGLRGDIRYAPRILCIDSTTSQVVSVLHWDSRATKATATTENDLIVTGFVPGANEVGEWYLKELLSNATQWVRVLRQGMTTAELVNYHGKVKLGSAQGTVIKQGKLSKRSANKNKAWRERWFSLQGQHLLWYKKEKSLIPDGHMVIDATTRVMLPMDETKPHCFDVKTSAVSTPLRMQCVNNGLRNEWLTAICGVAERSMHERTIDATRRADGSVLKREADKSQAKLERKQLQRRQRSDMDSSSRGVGRGRNGAGSRAGGVSRLGRRR